MGDPPRDRRALPPPAGSWYHEACSIERSHNMEIQTERREEFSIVRVTGRIVRDNQNELRAVLDDLLDSGTRGIALDFGGVEFMDSSGMGCCVSFLKRMHDRNHGLVVVFGASDDVARVWRLIRLDVVIPLVSSEEEALSRLRASGSA